MSLVRSEYNIPRMDCPAEEQMIRMSLHNVEDIRSLNFDLNVRGLINDVVANCGVIVAGILVGLTGNRYPDLVIGCIIAVVVFYGALRILRLR